MINSLFFLFSLCGWWWRLSRPDEKHICVLSINCNLRRCWLVWLTWLGWLLFAPEKICLLLITTSYIYWRSVYSATRRPHIHVWMRMRRREKVVKLRPFFPSHLMTLIRDAKTPPDWFPLSEWKCEWAFLSPRSSVFSPPKKEEEEASLVVGRPPTHTKERERKETRPPRRTASCCHSIHYNQLQLHFIAAPYPEAPLSLSLSLASSSSREWERERGNSLYSFFPPPFLLLLQISHQPLHLPKWERERTHKSFKIKQDLWPHAWASNKWPLQHLAGVPQRWFPRINPQMSSQQLSPWW